MSYEKYNMNKLLGFVIIIIANLIYFEGITFKGITNSHKADFLKNSFFLDDDDD